MLDGKLLSSTAKNNYHQASYANRILTFRAMPNNSPFKLIKFKVASHQFRYIKGWRRYSFFMFSKQFLSYHKEGVKLPGWYFICLVIYLTTINDIFISIQFINLAIFSIPWSKSGVEVPTDQVLCKTMGISKLHCALHTHMLTNAKSVLTLLK